MVPTFIKEVVYEDMKAFCSMQGKLAEPKIKKVVGEFFSYVTNLETKLIVEIVSFCMLDYFLFLSNHSYFKEI